MGSLFYLVTLATVIGGQEPAPGPAQARRLTLVYTVNNFGATDPMGCPHKILHDGGLSRRMTCVRQLEAAEGPILLVDGGSTLFSEAEKAPDADREKLLLKAEYICEAYSRMGYKAMAVGTADLLLGIAELSHIAGRAKFPFLCANLETPAGMPFKASTVVEVAGLRVGIVGLLVDSIGKVYLEKTVPGGKVLPAIDTARKLVGELRGKVDLVVVLSHNPQNLNRRLAKDVEGIDIIVDPSIEYGNSHTRVQETDWEETVGRTLILRSDGNGAAFGVLEIELRKAGSGMGSRIRLNALEEAVKNGSASDDDKAELADLQGRNLCVLRRLPLAPHYSDDLEGSDLAEAFRKEADVAKVPAKPAAAARDSYITSDVCKDCHEKQYTNWMGTKHFKALDGVMASGAGRKVECLHCHTTGYGPAFVDPNEAKTFAGVQCEACHGTKQDHLKDPATNHFGPISESSCLPCHNEDVTKKDFSYFSSLRRIQCPSGK